jgi:hypothetical protein
MHAMPAGCTFVSVQTEHLPSLSRLSFSEALVNFTISLVMNEWLSVGSQWPICGVVTADFGDGHVRIFFYFDSLAIPARYNLSVDKLPLLLMLSGQPIGYPSVGWSQLILVTGMSVTFTRCLRLN